MSSAPEIFQKLSNNIQNVILGKENVIKLVICSWISGGHVLLEDVPGTGKTILARALAKSTHVDFNRVQFTPDLLPSDILGSSMYNQGTGEFKFIPGPIFTVVLLADEINRATPRTQSALLESMSEGQVSIEGKTHKLDELFFTIATQNPIDQLGTFSLPEAQLDRFAMKLSLGYPDQEQEIDILKIQNNTHPIHSLGPVIEHHELLKLRQQISDIKITDEIYKYITDIVIATRNSKLLQLGASPRASIAITRCAQSLALIEGQEYVAPKHIFEVIQPILGHRIILSPESRLSGLRPENALNQIIETIKVPVLKT